MISRKPTDALMTVESRESDRQRIAAQTAEFLQSGKKVTRMEIFVRDAKTTTQKQQKSIVQAGKPVIAISRYSEEEKGEYPSIAAAARATGGAIDGIRNIALGTGRGSHSGGYRWKFKHEKDKNSVKREMREIQAGKNNKKTVK
ncbi:hypothetical protein KAR91_66750 [Candidatus Pacearchaeota archaeon]|nr:hypothetical protein [Candidatus Pacearchaeota archaeon]